MNTIDYKCGRYMAQVYSHDIRRMLKAIYFGYVEPRKEMPSFALGIIDMVSTWNTLGEDAQHWLKRIKDNL